MSLVSNAITTTAATTGAVEFQLEPDPSEAEFELPRRALHIRAAELELAAGDGRTLDIRLVPYNVPALVADPPTYVAYREVFLPGVFDRQVRNPDRVKIWLNFEHEQGLRGIVGHGVELRDTMGGLEGSFRVHDNADGEKALDLVRSKILSAASLEFAALRSRRVGGIVQRLRAHIDKVSLVRDGAYAGAGVLAVRQEPDLDDEDDQEPEQPETPQPAPDQEPLPQVDSQLADRLARLEVEPLARMAVTAQTWDSDLARFDPEQLRRSALLEDKLPVLEPDGTLNANAIAAAAAALTGSRSGLAGVQRAAKAAAARKLVRYYRIAGEEPPAALMTLARSA